MFCVIRWEVVVPTTLKIGSVTLTKGQTTMVTLLPVDQAQIKIDNKGIAYLIAKDAKLPSGFKAQIKDEQNLEAISDAQGVLKFPQILPFDIKSHRYPQVRLGSYAEGTEVYHDISKNGGMLLTGPPGTGKTVLAKTILSQLAQDENRDVIMFAKKSWSHEYDSLHISKNNVECFSEYDDFLKNLKQKISRWSDETARPFTVFVEETPSEETAELDRLLAHFSRMCRAFNCHLILVVQSDDGVQVSLKRMMSHVRMISSPGHKGIASYASDGRKFKVAVPVSF